MYFERTVFRDVALLLKQVLAYTLINELTVVGLVMRKSTRKFHEALDVTSFASPQQQF